MSTFPIIQYLLTIDSVILLEIFLTSCCYARIYESDHNTDQSEPVMWGSPYRITTLISPNQLCDDLRIGSQHWSVRTSYARISVSDHNTDQSEPVMWGSPYQITTPITCPDQLCWNFQIGSQHCSNIRTSLCACDPNICSCLDSVPRCLGNWYSLKI